MQLIEFPTPSGHRAYLKPYLTYGERRALQKVYAQYMPINPKAENQPEVSGRAYYEAQELALRLMLVRLVDATGKEYQGIAAYDFVMNSETDLDGDAILAKIDELTTEKKLPNDESEDKKK